MKLDTLGDFTLGWKRVQGDVLSQRTRQVAPRTPGVYASCRKWASLIDGDLLCQPQPPAPASSRDNGTSKQ